MRPARAHLEALLRARKLDGTLAPVADAPSLQPIDEYATASSGVTALDARLGGGFPRGQISEVVGARSSGRTSLLLQMLAAATARRELVALIDVLDMLDVASAEASGIDLDRLLWIRGQVIPNVSAARDLNERALDHAIKAVTLVLQAGNFGLVAFDAMEAPPHTLERLPFTTWRRLHRIFEGSQTACVLFASSSIARSSGGLTVRVGRTGAGRAGGVRVDGLLCKGIDLELNVVRAHRYREEDVRVPLSTACC
ncbi:MAG: hypothetical protein ABW292_05335 [Vicinamibacterales bacterium]